MNGRIMEHSRESLNPMGKAQTGQPITPPIWHWVGDRGLRVTTGEATLACYGDVISQKLDEIEDLIPADDSLLVILRPGAIPSAALWAALTAPAKERPSLNGKLHVIPVEYGGAAGPDLPDLAARSGLNVASYINRHAAAEYTVAFLGFQPGFPYLNGLPGDLQAPRRLTPRVRVEAGSVAIGGRYAGIYPASGPGGWSIIGRTTVALFDPQRDPPSLLLPGDRLRFVPQ
jgi:KipI family sensor histidine kinase inhibitor